MRMNQHRRTISLQKGQSETGYNLKPRHQLPHAQACVCVCVLVSLLEFYVLAISKVISGPFCDSADSGNLIVLPDWAIMPPAPCPNTPLGLIILPLSKPVLATAQDSTGNWTLDLPYTTEVRALPTGPPSPVVCVCYCNIYNDVCIRVKYPYHLFVFSFKEAINEWPFNFKLKDTRQNSHVVRECRFKSPHLFVS